MHEGLYRIEVHRESGIETFEIPNHVTRFTKRRTYVIINQIGIRYTQSFEDEGVRSIELLQSGSPGNITWDSISTLDDYAVTTEGDGVLYRRSEVEDGRLYKIRSSSFFSGPLTVYGLACRESSANLVSFVDLPSPLELASADFLYVWYSLKHRWPYAS